MSLEQLLERLPGEPTYEQLITAIRLKKRTFAEQSFREFVAQAWHVLEPSTEFVPGLHVDAICEHLQAVAEDRITDLIINVPPGHAKSLITCVFWPAWVWIRNPEKRFLFSSYKADLAIRDSVKCRTLIDSPWYQENWGDRFTFRKDQNQKERYENTATGVRVITSVGTGTGERGEFVVVDDPQSADQADSDQERTTANDWWTGTMSTRLNDLEKGHRVVIQQRLHEDDLTGHLLEKGGRYEHLVLPAEFDPARACQTSIWKDPRTQPGELLWPKRITRETLDRIRAEMGSYRYAGQYLQRPSPSGGGIFKRFWWRFWKPKVMNLKPVPVTQADGTVLMVRALDLPDEFDEVLQSWDCAFKDLKESDYVAGGVWASKGGNRFLLDQVHARLDFPGTVAGIRLLTRKYPQATLKLIEDKANGPAVISTLRNELPGLLAVNPEGGKVARANAVSPYVEAGNVYLPHPAIAPWVDRFIEECATFPNGKYDDQVDQMTQALIRMHTRPAPRPQTSSRNIGGERSWMA